VADKKAPKAEHVKCIGGPLERVRIEAAWPPLETIRVEGGTYLKVGDAYVWQGLLS
jgi:hypothetical protein